MSIMMSMLGDVFRQVREQLGLGQVDVAEQTQISQSSVSMIERGEVEPSEIISRMILYYRNKTAEREIISK